MIYTVDAKGNILLPVIEKSFCLNNIEMNKEINRAFEKLNCILDYKGISYSNLKSSLIPRKDRKEILLVFDSNKIKESSYGNKIMSEVLKFFDDSSMHSCKSGDFIGNKSLLKQYINIPSNINYCSQIFFVYINNLSKTQFNKFASVNNEIYACIGSVDLTYSSPLKDYCSYNLCGNYIKCKNKIIIPHEEDMDYRENINNSIYLFDRTRFKVLSIPADLYGLFLTYKIETSIIGTDKQDVHFSIISIAYNSEEFSEFDVAIEEEKLKYLKNEKMGTMKKMDCTKILKSEFETLLKSKMKSSYLYNLEYLEEYNVSKFNVLLEFKDSNYKPYKVVVALKYIYDEKKLEVITLY